MFRKIVSWGVLLCLGIALLGQMPAASAQEATPIAYGEPVNGDFTRAGDLRFTFTGSAQDIIYIFPLGTAVFSTLAFEIKLTNSSGEALGKVYNKERLKPVLLAELPADDTYTITLTGDSAGEFSLLLQKTENLLPGVQVTGIIESEGFHFYRIFSPQPLTIELDYQRVEGTFSPELRIEDFTLGFPREVAAVSGRAMQDARLRLVLEANVEYLVTISPKPFDFASILETVTPLNYSLTVRASRGQ